MNSTSRKYMVGQQVESRYSSLKNNKRFLNNHGISYEPTEQNNIVISYDWHHPRFISLVTFKFRWQGTSDWEQKKRVFMDMDSSINSMPLKEWVDIAPELLDDYMHNAEEVFAPECYEAVGHAKTEWTEKYQGYMRAPRFRFGKYKGKSITWVADHDLDYIEWMVGIYNEKESWFYSELAQLLASKKA